MELADGARLGVRPVRPRDRALVARFFGSLGERSRLDRFFTPKPHFTERDLDFLSGADGDRHEALVAVDETGEAAAIARFVRDGDGAASAEFAIAVADPWQGRRVGTELAQELAGRACDLGVRRLHATMSTGNGRVRRLFGRLGRVTSSRLDGPTVDVTVELDC